MADWIVWAGGSNPLPEDARVEYQMRNGQVENWVARHLRWDHHPAGDPAGGYDIVAYQIISGAAVDDPVDHPPHYTAHPSGIECIQITEHMNFNLGNATKYIWRADLKHDAIEDLKKARWYLEREIARREDAA